jgi:hypothetical protein
MKWRKNCAESACFSLIMKNRGHRRVQHHAQTSLISVSLVKACMSHAGTIRLGTQTDGGKPTESADDVDGNAVGRERWLGTADAVQACGLLKRLRFTRRTCESSMTIETDSKLHTERPMDCSTIVSPAAPSSLRLDRSTAYSIFHERWWLDIATGGHWGTATVMHGNQVLGEMPYYIARKGMWRVSRLPPLTRTLGPVIKPLGLDPVRELRHRLHVTSQLVEQLPHFESFFQVFDYRVQDALAFALRGFNVSARYTFQISPNCTAAEVWERMCSKTRNVIRSAGKQLTVAPIDSPSGFMRFYEGNLASRLRTNAYGTAVMRELVTAFVDRKTGRLLGAYGPCGRLAGAIGLVWDRHTMYYLLSSRAQGSPGGSISLLMWIAIQEAIERKLTFDFDGFSGLATFNFLNGFGGTLRQRLGVERLSTVYSLARTLKHSVASKAHPAFTPNL